MDVWVSFWSALTGFISEYGLAAVALIVLLRSAAVPIPVPADLLVVGAGAQAREQGSMVWPVWLLLSAATTVGALLFYGFVRWIAEDEAVHYGRLIGLSEARLTTAETRLKDRGVRGVVLARVVPGLRIPIVAVCGLLRFRVWKFVAAVGAGALVYVGVCITIGYIYGPAFVDGIDLFVFPLGVVEPAVGLAVLSFWLVRARHSTVSVSVNDVPRRSNRLRVGIVAGALATLGANWVVNMLMYLVSPVSGAGTLESTIRGLGGLDSLVQTFSGDIALGLIIGVLYVATAERVAQRWNDWLRGLAFGALACALVVMLQFIAASNGPLPVVEVVRWGTYGVFLGLVCPLVSGQRCVA
jgi:membrane-associated protein